MPKLMLFLAFAALAAPALAASPFDGTWVGDLSTSQVTGRPETYLLRDGTFTCSTCQPAYTTAADGRFHPVPSDGFRDGVKIAIVDPHTVKMDYAQGGKEIGYNVTTISPDGATLSYRFQRTNPVSGKTFSGSGTAQRVAPMPAGAHPMSGSWQYGPNSQMTQNAMTVTFKMSGDVVTMVAGTGETYTATAGGPQVTQANDPAHTLVTITRPSRDAIQEQDVRLGQVTDIVTYTVLPDGKAMRIVDQDRKYGQTFSITCRRQ